MKTFKVGLIGCGRIGSLLEEDSLRGKPCTHAGGVHAFKKARLVAGCDIDEKRLMRFGNTWGVDNLYSDFSDMLRNESLDIVCIATWTHLHAPMVKAAVKAGVRGIFCEKPIAHSVREGRAMVRLCAQNGVPLVINHERRWDPHYQKARQLIRSGKIGEVRTIIGHALSQSPPKLPVETYGGGPMFHDGTHLVDLLYYLGGDIDWVSGHENRPNGPKNIEETAWGMMRFKNGAMGFIEGGGGRRYFGFELDIQGSAGRILIGNSGHELYLTRKSNRFTGFKELEQVSFPSPKKYQSPFIGGVQELIRNLRTGEPGLSSGEDGLKALELIFAIYRSASKNGKQVYLHSRN